jgi:hypothetical protein
MSSPLTSEQIKKDINSKKIKKILIGTVNQSVKRIWVIPNNGHLANDIMDDIVSKLTQLYPNQKIKKEASTPKIINISGTRNGRITISPDGRTNFIHIYVRDPATKSKVEDRQVTKLNNIIWKLYESPGPTYFTIGNKTYTITNFNQGTVRQIGSKGDKTDCVIATDSGNVYISLKGNTHQQWSGVSDFADDSNVQDFSNKLKQIKSQNPNSKDEYHMSISDDLILKSVYGKDFNSSLPGSENNVDHILIGEGITIDTNSNNTITANKTYNRGDIPLPRPHIVSRNTGLGDRNRSDLGIANTRVLIWPGIRNNSKELK